MCLIIWSVIDMFVYPVVNIEYSELPLLEGSCTSLS